MPRIRSIKPQFFASDDVTPLSFRARLTWIGLWTYCDDHGRAKDNTKLIKAAVWPLDELTLQDVNDDLAELAKQKLIVRYRKGEQHFLAVTTWHFHQSVNRPGRATAPPPPAGTVTVPEPGESGHCRSCFRDMGTHGELPEGSRTTPGAQTEASPGQGQHGPLTENHMQSTADSRRNHGGLTPGKERNGTETDTPSFGGGVSVSHVQTARARDTDRSRNRPPAASRPRDARCVEHEHDEHPPRCGACARARRDAEQAEQENRIESRHAELRAQTDDKRRTIDNCAICDDHGYDGTNLCDHDPDAGARAQRGRALLNQAMGWNRAEADTA